MLIVNGVIDNASDDVSSKMQQIQDEIFNNMPKNLSNVETYLVPLKSFNLTGIDKLRKFFSEENIVFNNTNEMPNINANDLDYLIDDLYHSDKKVIFTMGKGGVGKNYYCS